MVKLHGIPRIETERLPRTQSIANAVRHHLDTYTTLRDGEVSPQGFREYLLAHFELIGIPTGDSLCESVISFLQEGRRQSGDEFDPNGADVVLVLMDSARRGSMQFPVALLPEPRSQHIRDFALLNELFITIATEIDRLEMPTSEAQRRYHPELNISNIAGKTTAEVLNVMFKRFNIGVLTKPD